MASVSLPNITLMDNVWDHQRHLKIVPPPLDWSRKLADIACGDQDTANIAVSATVEAFPL